MVSPGRCGTYSLNCHLPAKVLIAPHLLQLARPEVVDLNQWSPDSNPELLKRGLWRCPVIKVSSKSSKFHPHDPTDQSFSDLAVTRTYSFLPSQFLSLQSQTQVTTSAREYFLELEGSACVLSVGLFFFENTMTKTKTMTIGRLCLCVVSSRRPHIQSITHPHLHCSLWICY